MKSLWNESQAKKFKHAPLSLRVYTSQLLGQNPDLVLHGGGNTSVKTQVKDLFGELVDVLYVKGSGWDLATIQEAGFAPVQMQPLLKMAQLKNLTDSEMVRWQRCAMLDPNAPNPSVEAILHAIIPFTFVDHTHADAVVTVTNTPGGEKRIQEIYGNTVIVIPYVMPGFILARTVYEMTQNLDWNKYEGMILLNHGIFTFDHDAKKSYEQMIKLVSKAEDYLKKNNATGKVSRQKPKEDLLMLASIRREISKMRSTAVVACLDQTDPAVEFSNHPNLLKCAAQGPLTPDHVIRTKRLPLVIGKDFAKDLISYQSEYQKYFAKFQTSVLKCLDSAPRFAVWPGFGTMTFGQSMTEAQIIADITQHTVKAVSQAERLGGWKALPAKDIFDVEYWELEQAKLKKQAAAYEFQGKVALVTGAASGIGRACVEYFLKQGACVVAVDVNASILKMFVDNSAVKGVQCDLTNNSQLSKAIDSAVRHFGGLDIVVSNAGVFPTSQTIDAIDQKLWDQSLEINLSVHQRLLNYAAKYLALGIDPAVVIVASKNVPAPGKGAAAYSVAKAGLTQLARVAALEFAAKGIRVNVVHPNAVFDTAIWTDDVLTKRAKHYSMTVEEYKKSNLLGVEISSVDVAKLIGTMAGSVFSKTTGSQVPIDGGNERVI